MIFIYAARCVYIQCTILRARVDLAYLYDRGYLREGVYREPPMFAGTRARQERERESFTN